MKISSYIFHSQLELIIERWMDGWMAWHGSDGAQWHISKADFILGIGFIHLGNSQIVQEYNFMKMM